MMERFKGEGESNGESNDLMDALIQKKRTYRLEIRRRKLKDVFDKVRKIGFEEGKNHLSNDEIDALYEENAQIHSELSTKTSELNDLMRITEQVNQLNILVYNLNESNTGQLEAIVEQILRDSLMESFTITSTNHFKQLFLHISLFQVIKSTISTINAKNAALWMLTNLSSSKNDPFDVVGKLVDTGVIEVLKTILKNAAYGQLYENVLWLSSNIALDNVKYREMMLDEGFIYCISNFLKSISEGEQLIAKIERGITIECMKIILNFCTILLSLHQKMEDGQFRIIQEVMEVCLVSKHEELFTMILNGLLNLFNVDNLMSSQKLSQLYQSSFFSQFFFSCLQNDHACLDVAILYKHFSYLDVNVIMMLVSKDLCMPIYLLLDHPLVQVREQMMFSLSNFLTNGNEFVQVASQLMLDLKVITMLEKDCWEVQKDAIYALAALLESQSIEQKEEFLSNKDTISIMCKFFNENAHRLNDEQQLKMLTSFVQVLEFGEYATERDQGYENNPYWIAVECHQTVQYFERIITHGSHQNAQVAEEIIEKYSWTRDILRDEDLAE